MKWLRINLRSNRINLYCLGSRRRRIRVRRRRRRKRRIRRIRKIRIRRRRRRNRHPGVDLTIGQEERVNLRILSKR